MMEGVTVLSQNLDYTNRILGGIFTVLFGFIFIIGISFFYHTIKEKIYPLSIRFGALSIICGLVLAITIPAIFAKPTTQYKVTIDKKVSLKDFNKKYQVIKQDGEIYTVVEREEE